MIILKPVFVNNFDESAKNRGLKIDTKVVLYDGLDGRRKVVGSDTISDAGVTDPNEFKRRLHGVYQNHGSGSDLIVIKAVVIHKDRSLISYPYEFH